MKQRLSDETVLEAELNPGLLGAPWIGDARKKAAVTELLVPHLLSQLLSEKEMPFLSQVQYGPS